MDSAHQSKWRIAEVVFGIPLLATIALQAAMPLGLPDGFPRALPLVVGMALMLTGAGLIVLARRAFAAHGQPTDPGHPTTRLITGGVFSISRNPLYLGAVCFLGGAALAAGLAWGLVLLPPSILACQIVLIRPEEAYLAAKFGAQYRAYAAAVHRWIGRSSA